LRSLMECNFTDHPFWYGVNVSPGKSIMSKDSAGKGGKK